jgi:predicted component of type VI protein secretion system
MTMKEQCTLHTGNDRGAVRRYITNFFKVLLVGVALTGCAAPTTPRYTEVAMSLKADVPINDGVLLPIDIITVNEIKADAVLAISPEVWFGNEMRERLTPEEIQKFAVKDGGTRKIDVRVPSDTGRIIVYADFENTSERQKQQIIIVPGKERFRDSYLIRVHNNRLELMP